MSPSARPTRALTPEAVRKGLFTRLFGKPLYCFNQLTSTNDLANELARGGASEGTTVLAETQTKGRGRQGRKWISQEGKSLTFSIVLRPSLPQERFSELTLTAAVGMAKALEKHGFHPSIKWPNDLLLSGRKVCGILTEIGPKKDKMTSAILGIGLNLTQRRGDFPSDLQSTATSLKIHKGRAPSREVLLRDILFRLEEAYGWVREGRFHRVLTEWRKRSVLNGKQVRVVLGGKAFFAQALDVDERGALLVRTDVGTVERLTVGEVEALRLKPAKRQPINKTKRK